MGFLDAIAKFDGIVNGIVWGPYMLALLVGTGIYITIRTKFFQVAKFGLVMKKTIGALGRNRKSSDSGISPFQAVTTALAATIGTGNVAGVATAIVGGGPGAIFWMWISAFFGMMTKYSEIVLAVHYREKDAKGMYHGGPMMYIEKGLHLRWLACIFAFFCAFASFGIGNATQVNSVSGAMNSNFGVAPIVTGVIIAVLVGLVIIGGIKRIGRVTELMVPFMAVFYVVAGIVVLTINFNRIGAAFAMIFEYAFNFKAAASGALGYTVMQMMQKGIGRGVFSNEAGLGSAPIAHASADCEGPVQQGLWGVFEVFVDTIVVCSFSALIVLTSGLWQGSGLDGAPLTSAAFSAAIGPVGGIIVTIALAFFAFSTILGWAHYGETAIIYLTHNSLVAVWIYRVAYIAVSVIAGLFNLKIVWNIADTLNGLMAIPNLIGVVALSGIVFKLTKDYLAGQKSNA